MKKLSRKGKLSKEDREALAAAQFRTISLDQDGAGRIINLYVMADSWGSIEARDGYLNLVKWKTFFVFIYFLHITYIF